MASPFATEMQAVVHPTDPQLNLIRALLDERDWLHFDNAKFVRRLATISVGLSLTEGAAQLNAELHRIVEPQLTKQGASKLIDFLRSMPAKAVHKTALPETGATYSSEMPTADVVPAGRYAVDTEDGAINALAFYKIDRPTEGRWAGYVFVKLIVGGDEQRMSFAASKAVLAKIAAIGAEAAMARYGHEIGECGMCGRQLTNDESRARGIGPVCAAKAGW